jgi:branched-chain amino acid transport system ATP-binding protein
LVVLMTALVGAAASSDVLDEAAPVIEAVNLHAGYGDLAVVRDVSFSVSPGEIVAFLGRNGVGKTTTLLTLAGLIKPLDGEVRWLGIRTSKPMHARAREGLSIVMDNRSLIPGLSAQDNLRIGGVPEAVAVQEFPQLGPLMRRRAGLLSGGEQQMLSIARAIGRQPRLLIVDELSQGLAPMITEILLTSLRRAASNGMAVLMVDQSLARSLDVADRFLFLRHGQIEVEGRTADFAESRTELERLYLAD